MLKKLRKMLKQQEGFTLVELMIVVVILGIISGIGIQQYGRVQESAKVSANQANIRIIKSAAQMYVMMADAIESTAEDGNDIKKLVGTDGDGFLEKVPDDPWNEGTNPAYILKFKVNDNGTIAIEVGHRSRNEDGTKIS